MKVVIKEKISFAHHGYDVKTYEPGAEVDADSDIGKHALDAKLGERKKVQTKDSGGAPENKSAAAKSADTEE